MTTTAESMYRQRDAGDITTVRGGAALFVRDDEGRILMERRSDCGLWGLIGGRIDRGETVEQAGVREAKEEAGLDVRVERLVGVYSNPLRRTVTFPDNVVQLLDVVMEASIVGGELAISEESLELRFFALDDLPPRDEIVLPAHDPIDDYVAGRYGVLG